MPQTFAPLNTTREERGKAITEKKGQIWRYSNGLYRVMSQSGHGSYQVQKTNLGWKCTCPDHINRGVECKHIIAVKLSYALREEVKANVTLDPVVLTNCPACGTVNIQKFGIRHNKNTDIQRYICRDCGKKFSINIGFEKMKPQPRHINAIKLTGNEWNENNNKMERIKSRTPRHFHHAW